VLLEQYTSFCSVSFESQFLVVGLIEIHMSDGEQYSHQCGTLGYPKEMKDKKEFHPPARLMNHSCVAQSCFS
jgi:hypothetical protein